MAASSRTIKDPAFTPRRIGVAAVVAMALTVAAVAVAGQLAMSRSASTDLGAPAPAVTYSHGSLGDGLGSDVRIAAPGVTSPGNARSLLRAEDPTGDSGAQAPVSPRSIPTR